jgi:hypothetical protein
LNTGIRALQGPRLSAWLHRHKSDFSSISQIFEKVKDLFMSELPIMRQCMSKMHEMEFHLTHRVYSPGTLMRAASSASL